MNQAPPTTSGLVRVTVSSGTRRVDLVLPGAVPVAELVPELARSVGLLDAAVVHGGYRVVTAEGRELAADAGLTIQGVEDGGLLTVSAGVDDEPPRVYDDVVEAMTDVVERDLEPWDPASGRRTALVTAGLLMALGAVALLVQRGSLVAGVAAATVALSLVAGAVVLSRAQRETEAAVAVGWMAAGYAAVAGLLLVTDGVLFGLPLAAAGGGAVLAALVGLVGVAEGRALLLPPAVVGAVLAVTGLVVDAAGVDHRVVLTTALVLVVLAGSVFPWLALGATRTDVEQLYTLADITAEPAEVDAEQVRADARTAHEILVAISGTVGLLLVVAAPLAVDLGLAGTLLAAVACLVVMLRTRQYRTGSEVLTGLVSGVAGLLAVAASLLWLHPDWRPTVAVVLAVTGAAVLALTLVPTEGSLRRGRLGDVAESVSLLALLPLAVLATGVFTAVRG
ncbi:type VII secretion integral membrane protein EccD [Nocardioides sp. SYSU DS0663]|uniref:type VII secretion integral membrane protein EccD n=1 Tax=Nocardioides sp. SYSU DS0663 TaxID=3416445 RepID=UPI003F4C5AF7